MAKAMLPATFGEDDGQTLSPEDLRQIDIFADVDEKMLRKFPGTVIQRTFNQGDVICREGEGGTTAFYILEGHVEVFIGRRVGHETPRKRGGGFIAALERLLGQGKASTRHQHEDTDLVPIDASVDLAYGKRATTLGPGDVFGEMSCLNLAPRSASVVAQSPCVMLEILRNMYEVLQRGKTFKDRMDAIYRSRVLASHIRNVAPFEGMSGDDIDKLRHAAELITVEPGQVVFAEGDDADAMYIIRLGQAKVSQRAPGGERTLAYLTRGDCFGETGLLRGEKRNATITAVDHPVIEQGRKRNSANVELVRINAADFAHVIEKYPRIRGNLEKLAEQRVRDQRRQGVTLDYDTQSSRVSELGLLQGQNLMLIDLERCTRCDQCVDACVAAHGDGISRLVREGSRFDKYLVPSSCRMCMDPVCMIGCPVGSIRRTPDLNIFIEDWCVGCGICARQCPYDAIQMHALEEFGEQVTDQFARIAESGDVVAVTERAGVCDQCSDLPAGPACVYACPHDAAMRVDVAGWLAERETEK
jgi:CRP-like cAMP-binding protein/Pyruvate/2-oxoacid:ferredoxin oxidoreductase delta subunit